MNKRSAVLFSALVLLSSAAFLAAAKPPASGPEYTSDAQMKLPENYRQWTYLTTGFDMSYNPSMSMGHHMFDNVFVNPESYRAFVETGTWPDKTVLVLEGRMGQDKGSINQKGSYQGTEIMGIEAHVKGRSALSRQVGLLHLRRRQNRQNGSRRHGLLYLPHPTCRCRHHIRPVLSHAATDRPKQRHPERLISERKCRTTEVVKEEVHVGTAVRLSAARSPAQAILMLNFRAICDGVLFLL